jgi:hypothetical protein
MDWKNYSSIRNSITTGDIYFTKATTFFGKIVNFITRSHVPHVGLFVVLSSRVFCIEINIFGKVSMYLASEFLANKEIIYIQTKIHVDEDDLLKDLGVVRYNSLGAILAPIARIKTSRRDCVEWVAEKLHISMPYLSRGLYPSDLYSIFSDNML